jgi:hypothetical protein
MQAPLKKPGDTFAGVSGTAVNQNPTQVAANGTFYNFQNRQTPNVRNSSLGSNGKMPLNMSTGLQIRQSSQGVVNQQHQQLLSSL